MRFFIFIKVITNLREFSLLWDFIDVSFHLCESSFMWFIIRMSLHCCESSLFSYVPCDQFWNAYNNILYKYYVLILLILNILVFTSISHIFVLHTISILTIMKLNQPFIYMSIFYGLSFKYLIIKR